MPDGSTLGLTQAHYLPDRLPDDHGVATIAYWSFKVPDTLIVFVHGFHGDTASTWRDFPLFLSSDPKLAKADAVFFGYNGVTNAAGASALAFLEFLGNLLSKPSSVWSTTVAGGSRPDPFSYSKVVIVAHSLGAVVVRRALLFAAQQAQPWLPLVKMVLFAPAHNGAFAAVLAQSFLSGGSEWFLGKIATNLALLKMPLVQELDPASQVISDLRDDTKAELSRLDAGSLPGHLVAERVVWAGDECVVVCNSFGKDPVPMLFKGRHHVNVCKPEHGFLKPLDVVLQAL